MAAGSKPLAFEWYMTLLLRGQEGRWPEVHRLALEAGDPADSWFHGVHAELLIGLQDRGRAWKRLLVLWKHAAPEQPLRSEARAGAPARGSLRRSASRKGRIDPRQSHLLCPTVNPSCSAKTIRAGTPPPRSSCAKGA